MAKDSLCTAVDQGTPTPYGYELSTVDRRLRWPDVGLRDGLGGMIVSGRLSQPEQRWYMNALI